MFALTLLLVLDTRYETNLGQSIRSVSVRHLVLDTRIDFIRNHLSVDCHLICGHDFQTKYSPMREELFPKALIYDTLLS